MLNLIPFFGFDSHVGEIRGVFLIKLYVYIVGVLKALPGWKDQIGLDGWQRTGNVFGGLYLHVGRG